MFGRFITRHIENVKHIQQYMLNRIQNGINKDEFISKVIPANLHNYIPTKYHPQIVPTEEEALKNLRITFGKNKWSVKNYYGGGYYPTSLPLVIQKNILQNPNWITAYTPYQSEISQGRLEILHKYQQMITGITGMELANAGLLDEANASCEAVSMLYNTFPGNKKKGSNKSILVSENLFPATLRSITTRCHYLDIPITLIDETKFSIDNQQIDWTQHFGAIFQYPNKDGVLLADISDIVSQANENKIPIAIGTDLMSCITYKIPGDVDIVYGNSQRFGLPLGYGGPHTGFFATKYKYLRNLPGKLVGCYTDGNTNVYRMALQTREQHIKKDKATSNICTSQVLLSNLNAFYGIYHGREGLINISNRIHKNAKNLIDLLARNDIIVEYGIDGKDAIFDTICINDSNCNIYDNLIKNNYLVRKDENKKRVFISISEMSSMSDIEDISSIVVDSIKTQNNVKNNVKNNVQNNIIKSDFAIKPLYNYNLYLDDNNTILVNDNIFNLHMTETDMVRYIKRLENKDFSLTDGMIPLGSCTMKLNATYQLDPLTWNSVRNIHPYCPIEYAEGYEIMISSLSKRLLSITGMDAISYQSCSGAMGEYAGLISISNYLSKRDNTTYYRNNPLVCLIPESAHGTNFASAKLAGYQIEKIPTNKDGSMSIDSLRIALDKHNGRVGCLMVTYPSTFGFFDDNIVEICDEVHKARGQVYLDGANMNAMCGLLKVGDLGADVCHLNLHKTFCIPHGGGGPGMGPIVAKKHLEEFLPSEYNNTIASAKYSSASILSISYLYLDTLTDKDLAHITFKAILNANYLKSRLEDYYDIKFANKDGLVAHEFIIDVGKFKKYGITEKDIAKRIIDYSFHPPTMSWPVPNSLMIEPTESESLAELDKFADAMIEIRKEIQEVQDGKYSETDNVLVNSPHSLRDLTEWDNSRPYNQVKGFYPLDYLRDYKKIPINRVDDFKGDNEMLKKNN